MPLIGATAGLYLSFNRTYESVAQLQEDMRAVFSGVLVLIVLAVVIGIVRRVHQDREEQQEQDGINPYTENPVASSAAYAGFILAHSGRSDFGRRELFHSG